MPRRSKPAQNDSSHVKPSPGVSPAPPEVWAEIDADIDAYGESLEASLLEHFLTLDAANDEGERTLSDRAMSPTDRVSKSAPNAVPTDRNYWLWVTRPEFYAEADGSDREDLDPGSQQDIGGWWSCHRDTRRGDLALLWRTAPKRDIGYLIEATSDAVSIVDDEFAAQRGWDYGCEYRILYKFSNPLTVADLEADVYLQDWSAYRGNFQRRAFAISFEHWTRLGRILGRKNKGYATLVKRIVQEATVNILL